MKQTAVEWLLSEFQEAHKDYGGLDMAWIQRFKQAKEMEKQHIIDAYAKGYIDGIARNKITAEEYYKETFKKQQ